MLFRSIHDPAAALEYARRLLPLRQKLAGELEIVMRVYFEKPRTTVGWKGLINDPYLDESYRIHEGLRIARQLLVDINRLGMPAGSEFLDVISPQYIGASDLKLCGHFKHSRYCFYSAEALDRFSRDHFGLGDFNVIKKHVHDGVFDITLAKHDDGFQCVLAVMTAAAALPPPTTALSAHVGPADKKGLCHHLANDGIFSWCGNV